MLKNIFRSLIEPTNQPTELGIIKITGKKAVGYALLFGICVGSVGLFCAAEDAFAPKHPVQTPPPPTPMVQPK